MMATAQYLSFLEVAAQMPSYHSDGRPITKKTVDSWRRDGLKLPQSQKRLRLKCVRIGGRWCVTPAALEDFIAKLTAAHEGN